MAVDAYAVLIVNLRKNYIFAAEHLVKIVIDSCTMAIFSSVGDTPSIDGSSLR